MSERPEFVMSDYTFLWKVKRVVYSVGKDFAMPVPVKLESLGIFSITYLVLAMPLYAIFGANAFSIGVIPVSVGLILALVISRPIFEERSGFTALKAIMGYLNSPKVAYGLIPQANPETEKTKFVEVAVWEKD